MNFLYPVNKHHTNNSNEQRFVRDNYREKRNKMKQTTVTREK